MNRSLLTELANCRLPGCPHTCMPVPSSDGTTSILQTTIGLASPFFAGSMLWTVYLPPAWIAAWSCVYPRYGGRGQFALQPHSTYITSSIQAHPLPQPPKSPEPFHSPPPPRCCDPAHYLTHRTTANGGTVQRLRPNQALAASRTSKPSDRRQAPGCMACARRPNVRSHIRHLSPLPARAP
jgi:hypothetical protein